MVLYTCPRCGYSTRQKNDIRKHYYRKIPCRVTKTNVSINILRSELPPHSKIKYSCKICLREFKRKYNFERHIEKCVLITNNNTISENNVNKIYNNTTDPIPEYVNLPQEKPYLDIFADNNINENRNYKLEKDEPIININIFDEGILNNTTHSIDKIEIKDKIILENKDNIIQTQDIIIKELRDQIEGLIKNSCNKTINNYTYNTQIVINPFGKENVGYISQDYICDLIEHGPIKSIPKLLKYMHFNPEHKENHNIKIPNKKQPYASIYNGTKWEISDKKQTIENMTDKAYTILNNHYTGANQYMTEFNEKFESKEPALTKRIRKDTEIMILNLQNTINI